MTPSSFTRSASLGLLAAITVAAAACTVEKAAPEATDTKTEALKTPAQTPLDKARANTKAFAVLPDSFVERAQTKAQEDLGRMLYYDTRLSKNQDISCNSCHGLDTYGVDNKPTSTGHRDQLGGRNSPTVYNAAGHIAQFWDSRAEDVEAQAKGPVLNPGEMAMKDEATVVAVLESIPGYKEPFAKAFPDAEAPITFDNIAAAIGAFERKLVTPSRWDKFLGGDDKALTDKELQGFDLFVSTGCAGCHDGKLIGGASMQKLGAVKPWPNQEDQGRFEVTKKDDDKMMFKVPSLRNVAKTGPWFHDGSVAKLDDAVTMMASYQLARELSSDEVSAIVAWLEALTGELPMDYIKKPELPESGDKTPAPDPS